MLLSNTVWAELPVIRAVTTANNFSAMPPYQWFDTCTQKPEGSIPHILAQNMKSLGYELVWVKTASTKHDQSYAQLMKLNQDPLYAGEADFAIVANNDNPDDFVRNNLPLLTIKEYVLTARGKPVPTSVDDLRVLHGTLSPLFTHSLAPAMLRQGLNFTIADTHEKAVLALGDGSADYTILNHYAAKTLAHDLGIQDEIVITELKIFELPVYIIMRKNHPHLQLLDKLDRLLAAQNHENLMIRFHQNFIKKWFRYGSCDTSSDPID